MKTNINQDQALSNSIANFAGSLGGYKATPTPAVA
jgi:hypothetical protein